MKILSRVLRPDPGSPAEATFMKRLSKRLVQALLIAWILVNLAATWNLLSRGNAYDDSDSAYYFQRGREIAQGRWMTESVIVTHLVRYPDVEHPSFDHWQPMVAVCMLLTPKPGKNALL